MVTRTRPTATDLAEVRAAIGTEIERVVVGQHETVDSLVIALAVGGHVLLEGVPGVAKTLLANAFARAVGLDFRRIQFTPDLLPSDVIGTMTLRGNSLAFRPGPVFCNVLLGDEINRTPPKTQAALLEAMQEGQVTVDGDAYELPVPFLVVATQNPIDYEGTYPLPEAQLDRFLMKLDVAYPSEADERALVALTHRGVTPSTLDDIRPVVTAAAVERMRSDLDATTVTDEVAAYAVAVVRQTRSLPSVALGASPRAAVHLLAVARGQARLEGRDYVTPDDVAVIGPAVLRHRLVLHPDAALERFSADDAIRTAFAAVPVPR